MDWVTLVAAFGLIMAVWAVGVLLWARHHSHREQKIRTRLGSALGAENTHVLRLWHEGKEATAVVPNMQPRLTLTERWIRMCRDADLPWQPQVAFVLMSLLLLAGFGVMFMLTAQVLWGLVASAAVYVILRIVVQQKVSRHAARFEQQFLDSLDIAARSLRAGHPLTGAFRLISEEVDRPIGQIFAEICQQQELGIGLEAALERAAIESYSMDLKLLATSVSIQLRSGGNLADMMERLALVIRDRIRVGRRIRVLTAQTQFSKRVLIALPIILFVVLTALNPKYMYPMLHTQTGLILLGIAGGLVLLGTWVMNRMTVLQY